MKLLTRIFVGCILASCSKSDTPAVMFSSRITVIRDLTDSMSCIPAADPILAMYGFENNIDQEAHLRLVLISDKNLNPEEEINLNDGASSEKGNTNEVVDYREQLVYSFYDDSRKAIDDFYKQYLPMKPLGHSECFATIARELILLSDSKASQRILIVYSDLQENTDEFSCFRPDDMQLIKKHPEKVAELLQKQCPLPSNLIGITVYFVYKPLTRDQDQHFSGMVNIYAQLVRVRGARIVIQATNSYYQP